MDARKLMAALAKPLRDVERYGLEVPAALALYCGLRRGEICALKFTDVDLKAGKLKVMRSVEQTADGLRTKAPKSASGKRTVPVPPELATILKAQRARLASHKLVGGAEYREHGLICPEWNGAQQKPDTLGGMVIRAAERRGFPGVTLHTLRRTYVTALAAHGVPPKDAQYLAGHSSLQTTLSYYTGVTEDVHDRGREAVSAAFGTTGGKIRT